MNSIKTVVLASGRGSNFQSLKSAIDRGEIPGCSISLLITDRRETAAEQFARENDIPVRVIDFKSLPDRKEFDKSLRDALSDQRPHLILTLGFMRILSKWLVQDYHGKIINIHPSLLPSFPGMHAQRQAIDYGVKVSGATVHFMDEGMDTGPVILQAPVFVPEGATEEELSSLILIEEHKLLVKAVKLFCEGRLLLKDKHVKILN